MQTFLPLPDFAASAAALSRQHLNSQRTEARQIASAILGVKRGWANHSATVAWRGHVGALARYGLAVCDEWIRRGYQDAQRPFFAALADDDQGPWWLGDPAHHARHRAALLAKNPDWYGQFGWVEDPAPNSIWPTSSEGEWVEIIGKQRRILVAA